jgi:hypothetical protein
MLERYVGRLNSVKSPRFEVEQSPSRSFFAASPEVRPLRIYRIPIHALSRSANPDHGCVATESPPTWKSADAKLTVPEQPRVSRSATSSPVPPKAKLSPSVK